MDIYLLFVYVYLHLYSQSKLKFNALLAHSNCTWITCVPYNIQLQCVIWKLYLPRTWYTTCTLPTHIISQINGCFQMLYLAKLEILNGPFYLLNPKFHGLPIVRHAKVSLGTLYSDKVLNAVLATRQYG